MSDLAPQSAAAGAVFESRDVTIRDLGAVGMVTLRADLDAAGPRAAIADVAGCAVPAQRRFVEGAKGGLGWMSPDELLYVTDYADAPAAAQAFGDALCEVHHMALDVSDARAAFRIDGPGARELLAKGAPVDLSPGAFGAGDLRRSRLSQIAAAFWLGEDGAFRLVCFRSVGSYAFDWLKASAAAGARPGVF